MKPMQEGICGRTSLSTSWYQPTLTGNRPRSIWRPDSFQRQRQERMRRKYLPGPYSARKSIGKLQNEPARNNPYLKAGLQRSKSQQNVKQFSAALSPKGQSESRLMNQLQLIKKMHWEQLQSYCNYESLLMKQLQQQAIYYQSQLAMARSQCSAKQMLLDQLQTKAHQLQSQLTAAINTNRENELKIKLSEQQVALKQMQLGKAEEGLRAKDQRNKHLIQQLLSFQDKLRQQTKALQGSKQQYKRVVDSLQRQQIYFLRDQQGSDEFRIKLLEQAKLALQLKQQVDSLKLRLSQQDEEIEAQRQKSAEWERQLRTQEQLLASKQLQFRLVLQNVRNMHLNELSRLQPAKADNLEQSTGLVDE